MSYYDPSEVIYPIKSVSKLFPIFDQGEGWFSVSLLNWDNQPSIGVRWNGEDDEKKALGTPQSRGLPTWFIIPEPFEIPLLNSVLQLIKEGVCANNINTEEAIKAIQKDLERRSILDLTNEPMVLRNKKQLTDVIEEVVIKLKNDGKI